MSSEMMKELDRFEAIAAKHGDTGTAAAIKAKAADMAGSLEGLENYEYRAEGFSMTLGAEPGAGVKWYLDIDGGPTYLLPYEGADYITNALANACWIAAAHQLGGAK